MPDQDPQALERFTSHRGLARAVACRFRGLVPDAFSMDDVYQEADIALWDAATRFDETRGLKFATYAVHYVRGRILNWFRKTECPSLRSQSGPCPDELHREDADPVDPGLASTDPRLRQLWQWWVDGKSVTWIAGTLGVRPKLVRDVIGGTAFDRYRYLKKRTRKQQV